ARRVPRVRSLFLHDGDGDPGRRRVHRAVKSILITGGSRGIGRAIVERFKAARWQVATCARALQRLSESPADFKFACDITEPAAVRAGVAAVVRELGRIDVLVNSAGLAGSNPLDAESEDTVWHQVIDV